MGSTPWWKNCRITSRALGLIILIVLCGQNSAQGSVFCRPDFTPARRQQLAGKLSIITGYTDLGFDEDGALRANVEIFSGGSQTARDLLCAALTSDKLIVLEDASNRADVVFSRVVEGRWRSEAAVKPPAHIVQLDFADFSHVIGDRAALAAFHVGWGVLHEIDHVVNDSLDAERPGEAGQCEETINRMRRECGLAERAEYFFTPLPGAKQSAFSNSLMRLAFDQQLPAMKKKRYWLIWDARVVGGLTRHQQLAVR